MRCSGRFSTGSRMPALRSRLRAPRSVSVLLFVSRELPATESTELARSLVLRYGWNATAYQLLNPGIQLWFSGAGDGVVGFVRHGRTRVVAGAPVCAPERLAAVAEEFLADARSAK